MPRVFYVDDYNYRTPLVDLSRSTEAAQGMAGGVFEFGPHALTPDECGALSRVRSEERTAAENYFTGESSRWSLERACGSRSRGTRRSTPTWTCSSSRSPHDFPSGGAAWRPRRRSVYRNIFRAVCADATYRPPRVTAKPRVYGFVSAVVEPPQDAIVGAKAIIDDDGRYTVRLNFDGTPWASAPIRRCPCG